MLYKFKLIQMVGTITFKLLQPFGSIVLKGTLNTIVPTKGMGIKFAPTTLISRFNPHLAQPDFRFEVLEVNRNSGAGVDVLIERIMA